MSCKWEIPHHKADIHNGMEMLVTSMTSLPQLPSPTEVRTRSLATYCTAYVGLFPHPTIVVLSAQYTATELYIEETVTAPGHCPRGTGS